MLKINRILLKIFLLFSVLFLHSQSESPLLTLNKVQQKKIQKAFSSVNKKAKLLSKSLKNFINAGNKQGKLLDKYVDTIVSKDEQNQTGTTKADVNKAWENSTESSKKVNISSNLQSKLYDEYYAIADRNLNKNTKRYDDLMNGPDLTWQEYNNLKNEYSKEDSKKAKVWAQYSEARNQYKEDSKNYTAIRKLALLTEKSLFNQRFKRFKILAFTITPLKNFLEIRKITEQSKNDFLEESAKFLNEFAQASDSKKLKESSISLLKICDDSPEKLKKMMVIMNNLLSDFVDFINKNLPVLEKNTQDFLTASSVYEKSFQEARLALFKDNVKQEEYDKIAEKNNKNWDEYLKYNGKLTSFYSDFFKYGDEMDAKINEVNTKYVDITEQKTQTILDMSKKITELMGKSPKTIDSLLKMINQFGDELISEKSS